MYYGRSLKIQALACVACLQTSPISFAFPREAKEIGDVRTQPALACEAKDATSICLAKWKTRGLG